jgi:hypothetical protein
MGKVRLLLLTAARSLLGGLEGVHLEVFDLYLYFDMGGKVADTTYPLHLRGGIGAANPTDAPLNDTVAAFTIIDDGLAGAVGKDATLFPPKRTLFAGEYSLTLHGVSS